MKLRMKNRYNEVIRSLEESIEKQGELALEIEKLEELEEKSLISYSLNDLIVADIYDISEEKEMKV